MNRKRTFKHKNPKITNINHFPKKPESFPQIEEIIRAKFENLLTRHPRQQDPWSPETKLAEFREDWKKAVNKYSMLTRFLEGNLGLLSQGGHIHLHFDKVSDQQILYYNAWSTYYLRGLMPFKEYPCDPVELEVLDKQVLLLFKDYPSDFKITGIRSIAAIFLDQLSQLPILQIGLHEDR